MGNQIFRSSLIRRSARFAYALVLLATLTSIGQAQTSRGWLHGSWEGTGYQIDANETWTMNLSVQGNKFVIEYPSLKCHGVWRLLDMESRNARFRERITFGVSGCANNGNVTIERLNRRQIAFRYTYADTREISASAILNKK